jgi:hypothetical protein
MTSFPKLDDTAQDTFGAAIGINYLFDLDQQLVFEVSTVQLLEGQSQAGQPTQGAQYGLGFRYQIPANGWYLWHSSKCRRRCGRTFRSSREVLS